MKRLSLALLLLCIFASTANAGRGIPTPYVTEGKNTIFTDGFYAFETDDSSDYRFRERLTADIGATDKLGLRFRFVGEQTTQNSYEPTQLEFAVRYEFAEKNEWLVDSGIYAAVIKDTTGNGNNAYQMRYLIAKTLQEWRHQGNIIMQNNFGDNFKNTRLSLRFGSLKKLNDNFSLGYQYFGDYGSFDNTEIRNNRHSAGPWLTYSDDIFFAETSLLTGLTNEERDIIIQWRFGVPF